MSLINSGYTTKLAPQAVAGPHALDAKYQLDSITDRNSIPQHMRYEGMLVYVKYNSANAAEQTGKLYYLLPKPGGVSVSAYGTLSAHWIEMPTTASSFPIVTTVYGSGGTSLPSTLTVDLFSARIFCLVLNNTTTNTTITFSNAVPGQSYTVRVLRNGGATGLISFFKQSGTASVTLSNSELFRTVNGSPITLPTLSVPVGAATGNIPSTGIVTGANYVQEDIVSFMCFEPGKLTAMYMPLIQGITAAR